MECEKYLVMKCNYIIQINQHFLSLYLVIFKNAVLPVLFFTHIIQKVFILLTLHYLYFNLHSIIQKLYCNKYSKVILSQQGQFFINQGYILYYKSMKCCPNGHYFIGHYFPLHILKFLMIEIKIKEVIKCICQFLCQVWKFDCSQL